MKPMPRMWVVATAVMRVVVTAVVTAVTAATLTWRRGQQNKKEREQRDPHDLPKHRRWTSELLDAAPGEWRGQFHS